MVECNWYYSHRQRRLQWSQHCKFHHEIHLSRVDATTPPGFHTTPVWRGPASHFLGPPAPQRAGFRKLEHSSITTYPFWKTEASRHCNAGSLHNRKVWYQPNFRGRQSQRPAIPILRIRTLQVLHNSKAAHSQNPNMRQLGLLKCSVPGLQRIPA